VKLTYGSYLRVPELLALQHPLSSPAHHDEMLFIVIHQVYELWFKQLLHELEAVIADLDADRLMPVAKHFRRIHTIQRILLEQVDVLETMTPQEFNAFRDNLNPASGFQSVQFREVEFVSGLQKTAMLQHLELTPAERERLERRLQGQTLSGAFFALLGKRGYAATTPEERVAALQSIYENADDRYDLYMLCEDLIEFDERLLLWRGRHIRMVERMIGAKMGTGGSPGVAYLATTLDKKIFPELWDVRTHLGKGTYA